MTELNRKEIKVVDRKDLEDLQDFMKRHSDYISSVTFKINKPKGAAERALDEYIKDKVFLQSIDLGAIVRQNRAFRNEPIPDDTKFFKERELALLAQNVIDGDYATDVLWHVVAQLNVKKVTRQVAKKVFKLFNLTITDEQDDDTDKAKNKKRLFTMLFNRYLKSYHNMGDRTCRNYSQYDKYSGIDIDSSWKPVSRDGLVAYLLYLNDCSEESKLFAKQLSVVRTLRALLGFEFLREFVEIPIEDLTPINEKRLSIDRIDGNNDYYLWNLRWADDETQNSNRGCSIFVKIENVRTHRSDVSNLHRIVKALCPHDEKMAKDVYSELYHSYRQHGNFDHVKYEFSGFKISLADNSKESHLMTAFEGQHDLKKNK